MTIIGIDLGTTNSAVAYLKNGKPEIIENTEGGRTTPSVFQQHPKTGEFAVGHTAKASIAAFPDHTVMEVKRFMGSDKTVMIGSKEFRPEEISARILRYLKKCAEDRLGIEVKEAVITVPAYFSDAQRKATQKAGEMAGFKVERIINEPTAAAIAYGFENIDRNQNILVYDLGGGTFDVSVVEIFEGVVEVKASGGNNHLGGMDFDNAITEWILKRFEKENSFDLLKTGTPEEINSRKWRIKTEAENAKRALSSQVTTKISLPYIAIHENMPISIDYELTRMEFEKLIKELADSTLPIIDQVLQDAKMKHSEIDEVLLVGGSIRIPYIQEIVKKKFGKELKKDINPDEAIALGAAVQAGIKSGEISSSTGLMVTDVCPYTLGIEVVRYVGGQEIPGYFDPIIPRNSTVPITKSNIYHTVSDDQTFMNIQVFQGEDTRTDNNTFINNIELTGIPAAPRGQQGVEVKFQYDINGNLQVEATVISTGKKQTGVMRAQYGVMTDQEVAAATEELNQDWQNSELYEEVKAVIYRAEKIVEEGNDSDKAQINMLLQHLKTALSANDKSAVKKYEEELTDLLIELV